MGDFLFLLPSVIVLYARFSAWQKTLRVRHFEKISRLITMCGISSLTQKPPRGQSSYVQY
ncbi:hypothetical protein GYMLUDRAFT_34961 [Collybiopsis luxurians FD-317 M1]|nr:hypothetical protein GYMLUDRAFT_34961 [Collybiopsis luxurians FD-317 M1]